MLLAFKIQVADLTAGSRFHFDIKAGNLLKPVKNIIVSVLL